MLPHQRVAYERQYLEMRASLRGAYLSAAVWLRLWQRLRILEAVLDGFQLSVSYSGTHQEATPIGTNGNSISTPSITVSGANPVLLISGGYEGVASDQLSNITFGGSGTVASVIAVSSSGGANAARAFLYCVKAPSGSGVVTANFTNPVDARQLAVALFNGADQTNPCPTGDAASDTSNATSITVTANNLTVSDASYGSDAHTITGDCNGVTPNQIYLNSTTALNLQTGYRIGTGGVGFALTAGGSNRVGLVARIVADASAPGFLLVRD